MKSRYLHYLKNLNIYHYVTLFFVVFLSSMALRKCVVTASLKKDGVMVNVKIIEYLPPGKGMSDAYYRCEFVYKGEIKILISQSRISQKKSSYEGQYFPALYLDKYDELRILMTPDDFEEFGIKYPDSLLNRFIDTRTN